jgi:hypothetical protein
MSIKGNKEGFCRFFTFSIVQILLIRVLICGIVPKPLSKGLLKLGCSEEQICGIEQLAVSNSQKVRDEMMMSFLSGKKERKRARRLLQEHCPYITVHKCKIEDSYCLQLRVNVQAESSDTQVNGLGCSQRTRENQKGSIGGKRVPSVLEASFMFFFIFSGVLRPSVLRFSTGSI